MVKSIFKEIIIILLLLLAVVLALGVLFYDYIPSNKKIPPVSKYKTADSVTAEIAEQITESETVLVTYQITADDLKDLTKSKTYNPGKANPFSTYEDPQTNTNEENNVTSVQGNVGQSNLGNGNGTTNTNTNKNNTFYQNTGTK